MGVLDGIGGMGVAVAAGAAAPVQLTKRNASAARLNGTNLNVFIGFSSPNICLLRSYL
jgi:hypothetical protein